ncbi:FACT complex subunit SPT16-like [Papaver somniferum]|uniref:FACT complex subunit SPT16-like n=1 Tax=Papaver somniferum TaxID=3469 RepID=UPI000E703AFE|nr:FACT complex subunit SPT16-like [Papaver somniferum]
MEVPGSPKRIGNYVTAKYRETEESEEERMIFQATLARWLKRDTARRLLRDDSSDVKSEKIVVPKGPRDLWREQWKKEKDDAPALELEMHEEHKVGETVVGTLEAHVNGFIYTASSFHQVFMHANLESYFMRLGGKMMPPLLQFHLQQPVIVETKETKDIQFYLVTSDKNADNKDKHTMSSIRNEDLENFVHKVQQEPQSRGSKIPIYFNPLDEFELDEFEFSGAFPAGASTIISLTFYALEKETPFAVVLLSDIEIVNLAKLGPESIDMTVVFEDFKRDVLQIRSIPLKFLTGIKERLHSMGVKYYVNSKSLDEYVSERYERVPEEVSHQDVNQIQKGPNRVRTGDLLICSQMLYH